MVTDPLFWMFVLIKSIAVIPKACILPSLPGATSVSDVM